MQQFNGILERTLRQQKRKALNKIWYIQKNITLLTDDDIRKELTKIYNILQPDHDNPWIPAKPYNLYIFLLSAIDPLNHILTLSTKSNYIQNQTSFNTLLKPIKTNLIQSVGENSNGFFHGVVHKNDMHTDIWNNYIGNSIITLYTDMVGYRTNGTYIDLDAYYVKIQNKVYLANTVNFRSETFYKSKKKLEHKLKIHNTFPWGTIHLACTTWKPLPYEQYLNPLQITQLKSIGKL